MKLLLKLLGISDYIENLEKYHKEDNNTITELYAKNTELRNQLKDAEQELEETYSSLNELLATKTRLTAEVLKLREQIKTLEQSNSEYLADKEYFKNKLDNYKCYLSDVVEDLVNVINADYD